MQYTSVLTFALAASTASAAVAGSNSVSTLILLNLTLYTNFLKTYVSPTLSSVAAAGTGSSGSLAGSNSTLSGGKNSTSTNNLTSTPTPTSAHGSSTSSSSSSATSSGAANALIAQNGGMVTLAGLGVAFALFM